MADATAPATSTTPLWLAGPSERRLQEISSAITSRAPRSPKYTAAILEDVAALRRLAQSFLLCANAYSSPILRLPPELMREIFANVAALEPTKPSMLGWIRLGHVNSTFRSILSNMHQLWASAVCDVSQRASNTVFARAGNLPLTIHLDDENESIEAYRIQYAMSHLAIARHLKIREYDPDTVLWTLQPREMSGRALPFLETLEVEAIHRPDRDADWLGTDVYGLRPVLAPRLRIVRLTNIFIPFPAENLTVLVIERRMFSEDGSIPNQDDVLPSPEQVLDLLRRCSNVEHLRLENSIPELTPLPERLLPTLSIPLPHLKIGDLWAEMDRLTALWSHLVPSPNARLRINPDGIDVPSAYTEIVDRDRLSFLASFQRHISTRHCDRPVAIAMDFDNYDEFKTYCGFYRRKPHFVTSTWEGLSIFGEECIGEAYASCLDITFSLCKWDQQVSFGAFLDSIPSAFLTTIDTLDTRAMSGDDLRRLFLRLPLLHTVHIRDCNTQVLEVLSASSPRWILPQLRHLRLEPISLCVERNESMTIDDVPFQDIIDMIFLRATAGLRLQSLKVTWVTLVNTDQAAMDTFTTSLKAIVPAVEVILPS
ncbi:unnamed protein product [Peniophora sp. CBMAI 1063]|nr:unnamed protein product [Peniophora sp. CBMAI 1063]